MRPGSMRSDARVNYEFVVKGLVGERIESTTNRQCSKYVIVRHYGAILKRKNPCRVSCAVCDV